MNDRFIQMLIKERKKQGISARELGGMVGTSGRAITFWETGKRKPSLHLADKTLKALGVSMTIGKE